MSTVKKINTPYVLDTTEVTIKGNLVVEGIATTIESVTTNILDNEIVLNYGESGSGVTLGSAGIVVDRGLSPNVEIRFDESISKWQIKDTVGYANISVSSTGNTVVAEDTVPSLGGNLNTNGQTIYSATGVINVSGNFETNANIITTANATSSIGDTTNWFNEAYITQLNSSLVEGTLTTVSQPNVTSLGTLISLGVSDTITVNSSDGTIAIANGGTDGIGNIGAPAGRFNVVHAQSTTAVFADVAERYTSDSDYEPGTVLDFGGSAEVTVSTKPNSTKVAGVVSTLPAYLMNDGLQGANTVAVALLGRVPCKVTGTVQKGDLLVSSGNGRAMSRSSPVVGSVIGKSLENSTGDVTIEVVVGVR